MRDRWQCRICGTRCATREIAEGAEKNPEHHNMRTHRSFLRNWRLTGVEHDII